MKGVKEVLDKSCINFQKQLFRMGFLFTDDVATVENVVDKFPFYGLWLFRKIRSYCLIVSRYQKVFTKEKENQTIILVGHAYNPFTGDDQEDVILEHMQRDESTFYNILNQLTGVFTIIVIKNSEVKVFGDATCMQSTFWGSFKNHMYVSSHTNLIGDIANLEWDPYVEKLVNYRFFKLLGNALPGDLTQFKEIKRLTPNFCAKYSNFNWTVERFYLPKKKNLLPEEIANQVSALLTKNLSLIAKKWKSPAISCTGGCDSKTTLACASGLYDSFSYFSYISSPEEEVDALAAENILKSIGKKNQIYRIPKSDDCFNDIEKARIILNYNSGNIRETNKNDVRKRIFFEKIKDFDVEVKSWASEIGRAYYSKRFNNRINFGKKPTPRKCTAMYKFFLYNIKLIKKTDSIFENYLKTYFQQDPISPIDWQEQFFWEYRVPSWNGLVITGEHRYSFDITIPYNNRYILELLVSAPIENRIDDTIYSLIRKTKNPKIDQTGISVVNVKHTSQRAKLEDLYYRIMTKLIF